MTAVNNGLLKRALGLGVLAAAVAAVADLLVRRPSAEAMASDARTARGIAIAPERPGPTTGSILDVVNAVRAEVKRDNVALSAAGLAFYGLVALVPALIAIISVYGLVADPTEAEQLVADLSDALPADAARIITGQLTRIADAPSSGLSLGLAASLLGLLWTVSAAFQALIKGINDAYDQIETRNFAVVRGLALLLAFGAVVLVLVVAALSAAAPLLVDWLGLSDAADRSIELLRWPVLVLLLMGALALLYRFAPNRRPPRRWWATVGALVATLLWGLASVGFSIYVSTAGTYVETYGALAGVIILMFWLFMGGFAVLVGAEVNSVLEQRAAARPH